jgi:hypothetical protein
MHHILGSAFVAFETSIEASKEAEIRQFLSLVMPTSRFMQPFSQQA